MRCGLLCGLLLVAASLLPVAAARAAAWPLQTVRAFGRHGTAQLTGLGPTYAGRAFSTVQVEPDGSVTAVLRQMENGQPGIGTVVGVGPSGRIGEGTRPVRLSRNAVRDSSGRWLEPAWSSRAGGDPEYHGEDRIERLEPDGEIDRSFGGPVEKGFWGSEQTAHFPVQVILPLANGAVMVAGWNSVARYLPDGTLDRSFGTDGEVDLESARFPGSVQSSGQIAGLLEGEGGRTIVVKSGKAEAGDPPGVSQVIALDPGGDLDPTFAPPASTRLPGTFRAFANRPGGGFLIVEAIGNKQANLFGWLSSTNIWVGAFEPDGRPDPSFGGGDGVATFDLGPIDEPESLLALADGSIAIGGSLVETARRCWPGSNICGQVPFLLRLHADGSADREFGRQGVVRMPSLADPEYSFRWTGGVLGLGVAGDRLIAAGGSGTRAFVAELGARGNPVADFGTHGLALARAPRRSESNGEAVAIDAGGGVLVAGSTTAGSLGTERGGIFRLLPDGRLDRSYGDGAGFAWTGEPSWGTPVLTPDPRGGTYLFTSGGFESEVVRLRPGGSIDRRFGNLGRVTVPLIGHGALPADSEYNLRHEMVRLPDGDLVVLGVRPGPHGNERLELRRLSARGHLVPSFGVDGVLDFRSTRLRNFVPYDLEAGADGDVFLAGEILSRTKSGGSSEQVWNLAVARLSPDGSLDPSFGHGGVAVVRSPTATSARALATGPGGAIFVAGRSEGESGGNRLLLLRLGPDGHLVRRFPAPPKGDSWEAGARARTIRQVIVAHGHVLVLSAGAAKVPSFSLDGRYEGSRQVDRRGFGVARAAVAGARVITLTQGSDLYAFALR